ncbi:MAG: 3-hydroxyisobutyrate dehydrogenase [Proteobacteria bacterium]|nr:3-hydroxyisobutyrate dehydrogenase [Pseudomonadota bacterium]
MSNIAFIGLGNMGSGMCANLVNSGHRVVAFDLNSDAVSNAEKAGAIAADTIATCVADAEFIITMLPAGKHVHGVYFEASGVLANANANALLIDCSTIAVAEARSAASQAQTQGFRALDAPVSGGVAAANAGTLTFMVGGEADDFARATGVLQAMGQNVFHAGPSGNGQAAKTANNMLLGISMIATAEAFNLAAKLGLDAETFFNISSKASGQCWSMTSYCPAPGPVPSAPSNRDYEAGFAVAMMLKDLRLAQDAAADSGAVVHLGDQAANRYAELDAQGLSSKDFSVVMRHVEQRTPAD